MQALHKVWPHGVVTARTQTIRQTGQLGSCMCPSLRVVAAVVLHVNCRSLGKL